MEKKLYFKPTRKFEFYTFGKVLIQFIKIVLTNCRALFFDAICKTTKVF